MVAGDKLFGRLTPDKALRLVEDLL